MNIVLLKENFKCEMKKSVEYNLQQFCLKQISYEIGEYYKRFIPDLLVADILDGKHIQILNFETENCNLE